MTFFAQLCFLDSHDLTPEQLPGDVMLAFVADPQNFWGDESTMRIEWSPAHLRDPITDADVSDRGTCLFKFSLAGVRHRTNEYADDTHVFEQLGHYQPWLFATSQATKIGRVAHFVQDDPRADGEELLCTINSLQPNKHWPFTNVEREPTYDPAKRFQASEYEIMIGDAGCMYFMIDGKGQVRCEMHCY